MRGTTQIWMMEGATGEIRATQVTVFEHQRPQVEPAEIDALQIAFATHEGRYFRARENSV